MTQLSRPYQIALVAFALFAAIWFVALQGRHPSSTGGSGSSASGSSAPAAPSAAAQAKSAAASTPIYHGAAPGVQGLTRAINKAHGAVAQSQSEAKHFEHAEPSASTTAQTTTSTVVVKRSASPTTSHTTVVHKVTVTKPSSTAVKPAATTASMQIAVEHELHQGKTVLILFWNSHGSDDAAVHRELPAVQRALKGKVAVHYASASQVGAFGTITHAVQIYQTPTLLIVNRHGQTTVLTGLTDAFSIEQAVSESREA